ncbi:MAG TPA: hypothetical protein VG456_27765 [Candidatus Sulfopaludibacter sp.]|jgi:hypothetical protein|nr:hypothetical protein [Candidatus Sulfopaludibacter sp.]
MGYSTKASDWKVAGAASLGGGAILGAGAWTFMLQSRHANYSGFFVFLGAGLGAGGSLNGASAPNLRTGHLNWSDIHCESAFSAEDLNLSMGRLTTGSAGLAVGYGLCYLTAFSFSQIWFESQSCNGLSVGVGAVAATTAGMWKHLSDGVLQPD